MLVAQLMTVSFITSVLNSCTSGPDSLLWELDAQVTAGRVRLLVRASDATSEPGPSETSSKEEVRMTFRQ